MPRWQAPRSRAPEPPRAGDRTRAARARARRDGKDSCTKPVRSSPPEWPAGAAAASARPPGRDPVIKPLEASWRKFNGEAGLAFTLALRRRAEGRPGVILNP